MYSPDDYDYFESGLSDEDILELLKLVRTQTDEKP